jgi:hypothetical protein
MKKLSTSAIAYDADGYQTSANITVLRMDDGDIIIGSIRYAADELDVTETEITSKNSGWKVIL